MLTKHQNEILEKSLEILKNKNNNFLLIKGSAGVGKTYLVSELLKRLRKKLGLRTDRLIYCTAPTGKAVSVLQGKVKNVFNNSFLTTHSALKMKRCINSKTGEITFQSDTRNKFDALYNVGILVVDESSMLSTSMLEAIEKEVKKTNVKVIFLGDEKQINPVGEEDSPVFHKEYPFVELTEIIRQGEGNPIIDLSNNLSLIQKKEDSYCKIKDAGVGYVHLNDENAIIRQLAKINGTDALKYIAWTNKEVDRINTSVRTLLYDSPHKIEIGEALIFNKSYKKYYTNAEIRVNTCTVNERKFSVPVLNTCEEVKDSSIKLKYYIINKLGYSNQNESADDILVIHEDSEKDLKEISKTLKKRATARLITWKSYYSFIEQFADLKYNHAITIHKSQGSTFQQVILNVGDVKKNRSKTEKERLTYTAVTRASELLVLYNS